VTAAEMTEALVQINDRLAWAARAEGSPEAMFFCECGDCPAEAVRLSLDGHEEIRAREDLIFAPRHDAQRNYPDWASRAWRDVLVRSMIPAAERA
jgi:hypothetical protein